MLVLHSGDLWVMHTVASLSMNSSQLLKSTVSLNSLVLLARLIRKYITSPCVLDIMAMFSKVQLTYFHPLRTHGFKVRMVIITFFR